jgi:hypothetical protein
VQHPSHVWRCPNLRRIQAALHLPLRSPLPALTRWKACPRQPCFSGGAACLVVRRRGGKGASTPLLQSAVPALGRASHPLQVLSVIVLVVFHVSDSRVGDVDCFRKAGWTLACKSGRSMS